MPLYEYQNAEDPDDVREFFFKMSEEIPEEFVEEGVVFRRIYTSPGVVVKRGEGVTHKGQALPVSRSLPFDDRPGEVVTEHGHKVVKHEDGTLSTLTGDRIVRDGEDAKKHGESCGYVRDDS